MPTILISGAGSGIGRATARRLSRTGGTVVLCDIDAAALTETASLCDGAAAISACVLDVTDAPAVQSVLDAAVARFGRIDAIVTAAGIAVPGHLVAMPADQWRRTIEINLFGTYNFARPGAAHMLGAGGGSFIALASDAALRGVGDYSAYCASKHAVLGLVRSMALEYGQSGIRANAVCPGFVETPMADALLKDCSDEQRQALKDANPSGRFARAEEVAAVIEHLISPEMAYVNGIAYSIDGGLTAGAFAGRRA